MPWNTNSSLENGPFKKIVIWQNDICYCKTINVIKMVIASIANTNNHNNATDDSTDDKNNMNKT